MTVTLFSVDLETLRRTRLVTYILKGNVAIGDWAPDTKRTQQWLERDGVGIPGEFEKVKGLDGLRPKFFTPGDGAKFLKALDLSLGQSSTIAVQVES